MKALSIAVALVVALSSQKYAPLPSELVDAKTVYLVNKNSDLKNWDRLYRDLAKWGRFTIVKSKEEADITLTVSMTSEGGGAAATTVAGIMVAVPLARWTVFMDITQTKSRETLWSDAVTYSSGATGKLVSNLKDRMPKK